MNTCAYCGKNEGTILQVDSETLREFFICEECDYNIEEHLINAEK